mmetsp:Transcript_20535/g.57430  ORF Transcript_20535/g.57430 Transcript_20535/m.57430 type:complete len:220 (-) Transcript_20535:562-1221(-)
MPRGPSLREHTIAGHAVGSVADRDVAAAHVLERALWPIHQGSPAQQFACSSDVCEIDKGRPIYSSCTHRPRAVAVGQVLQQLLGHRRNENAVAQRVHAEAMAEGLERCAVVDAQHEAPIRPHQAVRELHEVPLSGPHEQLDGWVSQWPVDVEQPVNPLLVSGHPPRELPTPLLGQRHGHLPRLHFREEENLDLWCIPELVPQLLVDLPGQHHDVLHFTI